VHGIVGQQGQRAAVGLFQTHQSNAAVHWPGRIHAEAGLAVGVPGAAVDVGLRAAPPDAQFGRRQLLPGLPNAVRKCLFHQRRVAFIHGELEPVGHEQAGNAGRTDVRRRMGVRDRPPDVLPRQAQFLRQIAGDAVAKSWRERAEVGGNEEERSRAVVECDNAVIEMVVHLGGHARAVAAQHLRRLGGNVNLDHGRAELSGLPGRCRRQEEDCRKNGLHRRRPPLNWCFTAPILLASRRLCKYDVDISLVRSDGRCQSPCSGAEELASIGHGRGGLVTWWAT